MYWIVDTDKRLVEVWTPNAELPVVEHERLAWLLPAAPRPLILSVPELFRPV